MTACLFQKSDRAPRGLTAGTTSGCPRCGGKSVVQRTAELRPGIQYLTLRCAKCALVYDAQRRQSPPVPLSSVSKARTVGVGEAGYQRSLAAARDKWVYAEGEPI